MGQRAYGEAANIKINSFPSTKRFSPELLLQIFISYESHNIRHNEL